MDDAVSAKNGSSLHTQTSLRLSHLSGAQTPAEAAGRFGHLEAGAC